MKSIFDSLTDQLKNSLGWGSPLLTNSVKFVSLDALSDLKLDTNCAVPKKYPYSPHRRDWNFLWCGGFCKAKKFKEMYEAYLEFLEGWQGGLKKNPFHGGGMDIFWNYTLALKYALKHNALNSMEFFV